MLNIGFTHDPGAGKYDGVTGALTDTWNLVSMGTTAKDLMRYSDASSSTACIRITRHNGVWGIDGHLGIFLGYIYDNRRCKNLEATILDLEPGRYRAYVYTHGDAPNWTPKFPPVVNVWFGPNSRTAKYQDQQVKPGRL